MSKWWQVIACMGCGALASCSDDDCTPVQLVAVDVMISGTGPIDKVTGELETEEECGSFFDEDGNQIFTCWEQGGGTYTVRVYSGDRVVEEQIAVEADACHIKERAWLNIDLDAAED
jgi:hypothetical protein